MEFIKVYKSMRTGKQIGEWYIWYNVITIVWRLLKIIMNISRLRFFFLRVATLILQGPTNLHSNANK